jgi:DNA repair exonuclease SbcCD ATPase subunit
MKDEVIEKISRAQSGAVSGERMLKEANELTQKAGRLYADQARIENIIAKLKSQGQSNIRDGRIRRYEQRLNEYRTAIEEAQTLAVQKRNEAQRLTGAVTSKAVSLPRTLDAIDKEIQRLESMRTAELRPVISILKDWRASVQGQDLANVEMLRKQLGESFKAPELGSVRSIGEQSVSYI